MAAKRSPAASKTGHRRGRRREPTTKLDRFLVRNKLKPHKVASEAGISRQQMYRIRSGIAPNLSMLTALRIRDACGRLLLRTVSLDEVFGDE
jgi:DNA-binding Xre family transcriptional regulator